MTASKGDLPILSKPQAIELLRGGLSLTAGQVGAALPGLTAPAVEYLVARMDSDLGAPGARRLISARKEELRKGFLARLQEEQESALNRLFKRDPATAAAKKFTAESMTLMDDDAVANSELVSRVARRMQGPLEMALREVHLVTSHLAGRETVRVGDDPFGPDVFVKALLDAARDLQLEANGWDALLGAYERPLAEQIGKSYQSVLDYFRKNRIDAGAVRRELAAKQAQGRGGAAGPNTTNPAPTRLGWLDEVPRADGSMTLTPQTFVSPAEVRASLDHMMARMQADLRGTPLPTSLPPSSAPPQVLMSAINEMQHLGARGLPGATVGTGGADQGAWRELLLAKSSRTVDKLTIEVVGMLFDHVLQDNQVPAEIKAVLSRLQFPVLKVALTDADFFASSNHPARRLIDRLASTAIGWEPYGDENQRYKTEVERVVQQVLDKFDKDLSIFGQLLGEFDSFIGELPSRETDPVARAKRALEEAEKREVLVINTTIQVRRAFERVELEPYLREFLVGPWVQALVTATLRDEQTPGFSKSFRLVIHDLVWSVQPKVSTDDRKRLVALIPTMTRILRDGMSMVRMTEHDQQQFIKQLMASHAVSVRPVDQATYIKASVATNELRQNLEEMHITGTFPISGAASPVHVSPGAVQRAAENHSAHVDMPEPVTDLGPVDYEEDAAFDDQIAGWQRGSWFNFYDGKEVRKVKLRWVSPLRTLYMFSGGEDKSASVLSPETIKSYLRKGFLKPLESVPLTKRIVDRVVNEFEQSPKIAEKLASKIGGATQLNPA